MTFSKRTAWNLEANEIARQLAERRERGLPVLDLTESNPTRAGIVFAGLRERIAPPQSEQYEPDPRGIAAAREAVAGYYRDRGITITPGEVVLSASSSESYSWLFKLLCDPGDEVLVPRPGYPLFDYLAELEGVRVSTYSAHWDGDAWRFDLASLEKAIHQNTRAIVVVHPGNPTGAFLTREEARELDRLATMRRIAIISDEVFGDFGFARHEAQRAPSLAENPHALTFVLSGFSKVLALPQLKLGWTIARGAGAAEALARLEVIADTYLSVATPVQLAAPALLGGRTAVQEVIRARLETNLAALRAAVAGPSPVTLLEPEGGWAAVLRVPRIVDDARWAADLLGEGVLVSPGYFFDFDAAGHLVVSLLTDPAIFARGIAILAKHVAARSGL